MKRFLHILLFITLLLTACGGVTATPILEASAPPVTLTVTTPEATVTEAPPTTTSEPTPANYGPTGFPADVNPLTGLPVDNPALLERRPMLIKIQNLPRSSRPQWGLSRADLVFEYYTEEGGNRFAALFYGNDAEMVGPIRSSRPIDIYLTQGYDAIFTFIGGYQGTLDRLYSSAFTDRLVEERSGTPIFRFDPAVMNYALVNTAELSAYVTEKGVENGKQNLDGMTFAWLPPSAGQSLNDFFVRYSGAIYNHWQYDPELGRYLRFVDSADDPYLGLGEVYAQASDRLTGEFLYADNVVVLLVPHQIVVQEVWDIQLIGSGTAYAFRDGQMYELTWQRTATDAVISLAYADGNPFPFKPGTTWFEVLGQGSALEEGDLGLRFIHHMP
jgi:hypothetical protein